MRTLPIKKQISLCKHFSSLLHSGIPLIKSLEISELPGQIVGMVQKGHLLSESFVGYFNCSVINLIRLGEKTGELDKVLVLASQDLERDHKLKQNIYRGMFYPVMVLLMSAATVVFFLMFLLPQLKNMFESMDISLPVQVIVLINISSYSIPFLLTAGIIAGICAYLFKKNLFSAQREKIKYYFPLSGAIARKLSNAKIIRALVLFLKAGYPLTISIDEAAKSCGSVLYSDALSRIKSDLMSGAKLSCAAEKEKLIYPILVKMLLVVEES